MCGRLLICAKAQSEATHKPQQVCDLFLGTIQGKGGGEGSRHSLDPDLEPDSLASAAILIAIIKLQVSRIDSGLACGEAHSRHTGATLGALWRHTRGHPAALGQFGPCTLLPALCALLSAALHPLCAPINRGS